MEATQEARMTYCSLFLPTPTGECMAESTLWTPEVIILDPSATLPGKTSFSLTRILIGDENF